MAVKTRMDKVREAIQELDGREFTTITIRRMLKYTDMLQMLMQLAESGEIRLIGKIRVADRWIDNWVEIGIRMPRKGKTARELERENPADLPGWRQVFPQLFHDPGIPGKKRVMHEF